MNTLFGMFYLIWTSLFPVKPVAGVAVEEQGFAGLPAKEHPTPGGRDNE